MANYAVWNIRKRHEWLATPLRKKRIKRRNARRVGLLDAWGRKGIGRDDAEASDAQTGEAEANR